MKIDKQIHIYHSNAIEGNTLNLRETRYIVETRMAIGGKSLIEQQEVHESYEAYAPTRGLLDE